MLEESIRNKISSSVKDLPTLPGVAMRILNATSNPDTTVDELKRIISSDQIVAGRILRAVNSAYYGFPRQIDTLSKAIVILGFNNVRTLTLSVSMMEVFPRGVHDGFDFGQLWAHAVGTAHCARALARITAPRIAEQLFVAGLLHDIGYIAMYKCFRDDLLKCVKTAIKEQRPFYEVENDVFGFDHSDVGGFVAETWLLPAGLARSISKHHCPVKEVDNLEFVYGIHVADILCKALGFGDYGDNAPFTMNMMFEPASNMYGIRDRELSKDLHKVLKDDLDEASGFLGLFES